MSLPRSLDVRRLLAREMPGDTTVGVARDSLMNSDTMRSLESVMKPGRRGRIRFLVGEVEVADDVLIREWRRRGGTVAIDDLGGGTPVSSPEYVT